ncbi:MAG: carboxypeptidase regulatory-like domain-containing protein [Polyangiaceae bacterium]
MGALELARLFRAGRVGRVGVSWARASATIAATVVALGGIPGARLRSLPFPKTSDPVPDGAAHRNATIDVAVRDQATGRPLAGARVRALSIVERRASVAGAETTGADGLAQLKDIPPGEVWILADAPDHARASTQMTVLDARRSVEMDLGAAHTVDVLVQDELGAPVSEADVEIVAPGEPLPIGARTASNGIAHVTRLGPGPWQIEARASTYEDAIGHAEHDFDSVSLTVHKLSALSVRVRDANDKPAQGASVSVAGATLWPARSAETDDGGHVRISSLTPGAYALRASRGEQVSPIELGVVVRRGEERVVDLRLVQGRFVRVHVTEADGGDSAPIRGARLTLVEAGISPFPIEATTDAAGRARMGPVAAGLLTLGVRAEGFVARGAMAVADPPTNEMPIALVRSGVIVGRVIDGRGDPVDGATIQIAGTDVNGAPVFEDPQRKNFQNAQFDASLTGPAPFIATGQLGVVPGPVPPIPAAGSPIVPMAPMAGMARTAIEPDPWVTRNDGTFRAAPAPPGRVRVFVHHPQYVDGESAFVSLEPGGEARVDVVMHAGGSLEGRVLDAHERPVRGARVSVSAARGTIERTTRSASDGTFAFAALPADLELRASAEDDDTTTTRMAISIPEGGRQEVTVRLPTPRDPLAVSVVDERGWPVDAAQVTVASLAPEAPLRATVFTDAHGDAQIRGARGLPLRVEVRAPSHAARVLTADAASDSLKIDLVPGERAMGSVLSGRSREPVADAAITLYSDLGARHARTDARGAFALSDLSPGPATLHVSAPGFAPVTTPTAIPDSAGERPFEIDPVELSAEAIASGDVTDSRGAPVAGARVARDHVPTWLLVGSNSSGFATTDARGRFVLSGLPEGPVTLEAYAPELGRGRLEVNAVAGRTTADLHLKIDLAGDAGRTGEGEAGGGVALTLGETAAPVEVVIVSVVEGSEAEYAGLAPGDVLLTVDGVAVHSMADARLRLSGPVAEDVVLGIRRGDRTLTLRAGREPLRR